MGMGKSTNLKEGFRACGICPLDENAGLSKLSSGRSQEISNQVLSDAVMDVLKNQAAGSGEQKKRQNRTRVTVAAGNSVCTDDFADPGDVSGAAGTSGTGNRTGTDDGAGTSTATSRTRKAKRQHSHSRESSYSSGSTSESDANASTDTSSESDVPLAQLRSSSDGDSDEASDVEPDENNNSQEEVSEVTGLSGIKKCRESDLQVGNWVVVDFSAGKKQNQKLYLGRIKSRDDFMFEGIFM